MEISLSKTPLKLVAALTLLIGPSAGAIADEFDLPDVDQKVWIDHSGTMLDAVMPFEFQRATLAVSGPDGTVWTKEIPGGFSATADLAQVIGQAPADGRYVFEVRFQTNNISDQVAEDATAPGFEHIVHNGVITVSGNQVADVNLFDAAGANTGIDTKGDLSSSRVAASGSPGTRNLTNSGDLAIGGYGVFGSSDVNDVGAGKLRIFEDTDGGGAGLELLSNTETDGSGDLVGYFLGNDQGNFGLRREIGTSKTTIFGIDNGAPLNSLIIDSNGRIGLGTQTPAAEVHLFDSGTNTPAIRMEDGDGYWEFAENANDLWFIRDGIIRMELQNDGDLGLGTANPQEKFHVRASDGSAKILLQETQAIATNSMFTMRHNGNPGFLLENSASGAAWQFRLGGSGTTEQFTINKTSISGPELSVTAQGNMVIKGSYLSSSSRSKKQDIVHVDEHSILDQIESLPIYEWSYKTSPGARHIGPMAEEYFETFGLAGEGRTLAATDMAGLALASVKALRAEVRELKAENASLRSRVDQMDEMQTRMAALEARLTALAGIAQVETNQ
jgi:hypothetical protein